MKKISLVTGGAGFIGSHVAEHLLDMGHEVIVLDDLSGGYRQNIPRKAELIQGSINDNNLLDDVFENKSIDYIFHLAAYAAEGLSHFIRKYNYENNLIGTINLINRAVRHNVKHFVFTSSIAVYGKNQLPMTEDLTPQPEDPYGIAKYACELDIQAANKMYGLPFTIFRPHNVYGERQNIADPFRNVIGIFMNNILKGKPLPIFGDGKQKRAFTYIDDVAPYIAQSVMNGKAKNQVLNIGSDKPYTLLELTEKICKLMKVEKNTIFLPERNEVKYAYSDHSKMKKIFHLKKETGLKQGLSKMISWVKKSGPFKSTKYSNIEIRKNVPAFWEDYIE